MKCCLNQHGFKENQIVAVFFNNHNVGFFFSDKFSFSFYSESLWRGALWEVHCPHGRYTAGKQVVQASSLAGGVHCLRRSRD